MNVSPVTVRENALEVNDSPCQICNTPNRTGTEGDKWWAYTMKPVEGHFKQKKTKNKERSQNDQESFEFDLSFWKCLLVLQFCIHQNHWAVNIVNTFFSSLVIKSGESVYTEKVNQEVAAFTLRQVMSTYIQLEGYWYLGRQTFLEMKMLFS